MYTVRTGYNRPRAFQGKLPKQIYADAIRNTIVKNSHYIDYFNLKFLRFRKGCNSSFLCFSPPKDVVIFNWHVNAFFLQKKSRLP